MDMLSFFRRIIPSDGYKYLVEVADSGKLHHTAYIDFESMVDAADKIIAEGHPIYHACSSYKELEYNAYGYVVGRKQSNVKWVKSLWQDFDVGKLDKDGSLRDLSYATRPDALAAIKLLMTTVGLPRPLLVSSGNGFHAYWPFTEAVTASDWSELAVKVRAVYQSLGIKFDPSRDLDSASILRPVGSFNHGKEVKILRDQEAKPFVYYNELFQRYVDKAGLTPQVVKQQADRFENEFAGSVEFPPSSLAKIAEHCAQIGHLRDTGGSDYLQWFYSIGVAKHCEDGEQLAHLWSEKYSGYSEGETQEKLDSWSHGPTTCEAFQKSCAAYCQGCSRAGKIKSPVVLGYADEAAAPSIVTQAEDGSDVTSAIPNWPKEFRVDPNNVLQMLAKDEDGVVTPLRIAMPFFYLTERIRLDDGTYGYTVRMQIKKDKWREFPLPAKNTADFRSLKTALATYEVIVLDEKRVSLYVNAHKDMLRRTVEEVNTFRQFGWTKDQQGFLIGNQLITPTGRSEVRVSDAYIPSNELMEAGVVRGDKKEWSDGVEKLYNRENGEAYQYTICTQFGAPLVPLLNFDSWHGIPLALTSEDSGFGKSTVCKIGINALCDSRKTTIADSTAKAIIGRASMMNNLPLLVDEVTVSLKDPTEMSDVFYSLSNGRMRIGMTSDGRERAPMPPFNLNSTMTGNKNLMSELTESKTNPEATQMRIFEIAMENYPRMDSMTKDSTIHGEHAEVANRLVDHCHGVWADDYFSFVFANRAKVEDRLHKTANAIIRALGGGAAKERFYAYHMACALVGGWIARQIGAITFDLVAIKHWAFNHILRMRGIALQYSENVEEKFSHLLSELHGTILVTKHFDMLDSKAGNTEMPMLPMRQGFNARLVLGSDKERGKLFVTVRALDEWCSKQSISPITFRRQLAAANMLRSGGDQGKGYDKKVSIGRGVPSLPSGRSRCLEFNYAIAQGYIDEFVSGGNVVPISAAVPTVSPTGLPVLQGQQGI